MVSAQFWMGTGVTLGVAAVMGLGLGSYVTSPQAPSTAAQAVVDASIDGEVAEQAAFVPQKGPGAIHCTGCGPTLADRRWHADMAALDTADGMDSVGDLPPGYPVGTTPESVSPESVSTDMTHMIEPLEPDVARLVVDESSSRPAVMTRGDTEDAPPPTMMATAAPFTP